ncbi:MAG: glycosyltransferase, partial [Anaerolineales bacterium]|nr:glycosyltransferase [Anaerolineales bacterium]
MRSKQRYCDGDEVVLSMPLAITVVLPTYNEAENLPSLVSALFALPLEISVLVVDDNSPDGTGQVADELALRYAGRLAVLHRRGKLGLSSAYLQAFRSLIQSPTVEAIAQMDCDFSHDPAALVEMSRCLETADMVIGSRYVPGGGLDERWPFWRKALSAWGNFYARTILDLPLRDVTGGYRLWRKSTLQALPLERIRS